jgi:hypothetical protein
LFKHTTAPSANIIDLRNKPRASTDAPEANRFDKPRTPAGANPFKAMVSGMGRQSAVATYARKRGVGLKMRDPLNEPTRGRLRLPPRPMTGSDPTEDD